MTHPNDPATRRQDESVSQLAEINMRLRRLERRMPGIWTVAWGIVVGSILVAILSSLAAAAVAAWMAGSLAAAANRATAQPAPQRATGATGQPPVPAGPVGAVGSAHPSPSIDLAEAHALFEAGTLFIDTRTLDQFNQGHILGAYHLSTLEVDAGQTQEVFSLLSHDTHYVLYCDGGECEASENLARRLEDAFPRYHIMKDGFTAWRAAGYDIDVP